MFAYHLLSAVFDVLLVLPILNQLTRHNNRTIQREHSSSRSSMNHVLQILILSEAELCLSVYL